jgi:hypothetical protein
MLVGGVIPQPMPMQAQHEQIALGSLYAFDDRLNLVHGTALPNP